MRLTLSKALVLAAVSGAAASAASAQSITTLFNTNNNGGLGGGIYFQIVVGPSPITITSIDTNTGAIGAGLTIPFRIFTAPTTYVGNEGNAGAWTLAATGSGTGAGLNLPTAITLSSAVVLSANTSYGICLSLSDASGVPPSQGHYYSGTGTSPLPGALQYSNPDLTLNLGDATNVLFGGAPFNPRVWNGTLHYSIGGTTGACCLTNGSCSQSTSAGCAAAGGVYRGDNTPCSTANCPPGGACCQTGGACSVLTSAACTAASGIYRGDNTACASANCPGGYTMNCNAQGTFTDISSTGTFIIDGDDNVGAFTSSVTNALVTNANLYACTNGFITDSATFATFTNTALPVAGITFGLFPNWDDLYANNTLVPPGKVVHQAVVEGGVNVEIIQWSNISTYVAQAGPTGNFEVKIFGPGGPALVQYLYQDMSFDGPNGASSTVGLQWSSSLFYQNSFNAANSIANNSVCNIVVTGGAACYANCDGSTTNPCLNVLDFGCFLNRFAAGDSYANCDHSTTPPVLNVLDFGCFLNQFAAGCSSC